MSPQEKRLAAPAAADRRALEAELLFRAARRQRGDQLVAREADEPVPLALPQRRLWFFHELTRGQSLYQSSVCFRLRGRLDLGSLRAAIEAVVRRHEALRTRIDTGPAGEPVQQFPTDRPVPVIVTDLRDRLPEDRPQALREEMTATVQEPFDLHRDLPVRARVVRVDEDEHLLVIALHHMVSDGRSLEVLCRDLAAYYRAGVLGTDPELPVLPVQYGDFARWQQRQQDSPSWRKQVEYWRTRLADAPRVLALPLDRPRGQRQSYRGRVVPMSLPADLVQRARLLSGQSGCTLYMTLLTAFHVLLHRYSGDDTVVVGMPVAGRNQRKVENLVGFFVNSLAIRLDFSADDSFLDLLDQARDTIVAAMDHQDVPFDMVVEALGGERDLSHNPVFQTMFQANVDPVAGVELKGLTAERVWPGAAMSDFDLSVYLSGAGDGGLTGWFEYGTDLFDHSTIEQMVAHYVALVGALLARPDRPVTQVAFLSEEERRRIVREWGETGRAETPDRFCHEYLALHARRTPEATALECGDQRVTYAELAARTDRLAAALRDRGAVRDGVVAVMLAPSIEAITTIIAILKSGAGYLAIDPKYPAPWIEYVLSDSGAAMVVTDDAHAEAVRGLAPTVLFSALDAPADGSASAPADRSGSAPADGTGSAPAGGRVAGGDLACVLYTGGSTGRPKGVLIEHRNLAHHAAFGFTPMGISAADRCLQFASLSFDASLEEILFAVTTGATLVLRGPDFDLSPSRFAQWCLDRRISVLSLPTSYWHELVDSGATAALVACPELRVITIGGEAAAADRIRRWHDEGGGRVRLLNGYAPSECTISSSWSELTPDRIGGHVPIGRPVTNCQMYVLDEAGQPVGAGVVGELYVGGGGVSRGYVGRPDLTTAAFLPHPFSDQPDARLYRTGDRARYLPDGSLTVLGRLDDQIKLRGYRIEPGDIEATLRHHPLVRDALVRVREDNPGDRRLVAYVVPDSGTSVAELESMSAVLRDGLLDQLPGYLVPSVFVVLDRLPRTPSGKLDPSRLPAPRREGGGRQRAAVRSTTELRLLALWRQLLNKPDVGVQDDFFQHGGHSLLAVQLVARIERDFGRSMPVSALFPQATVARVARKLEEEEPATASSVVVPLRVAAEAGTVVLAPPVGGDVVAYTALASALPPLNVLALRSPGLEPDGVLHRDLESLAANFVTEMRAAGVSQPTLLGGWSLGGVTGLAMAQQLADETGFAPTVLVIDGVWGLREGVLSDGEVEAFILSAFVRDVRRTLGALLPGAQADTAQPDTLDGLERELVTAGLVDPETSTEWIRRRFDVFAANVRAVAEHRPRRYPGHVLLLLAEERTDHEQVVADWSSVAGGGLTVRTITGDHYSVVSPEGIAEIRGVLAQLLGQDGGLVSAAVARHGAVRSV